MTKKKGKKTLLITHETIWKLVGLYQIELSKAFVDINIRISY